MVKAVLVAGTSGVGIGVDVSVNAGIRVGPDNCPNSQAERNKLDRRSIKIATWCCVFTESLRFLGVPDSY
jgi:hypothetical protein